MSKQKKVVREIVRKEVKKKRGSLFEEGNDWKIKKN